MPEATEYESALPCLTLILGHHNSSGHNWNGYIKPPGELHRSGDGMTNCVNPDQTAVITVYTICSCLSVCIFGVNMIHVQPPIVLLILFDLILYVPSTIFQLYWDRSSWVEPVLSLAQGQHSHAGEARTRGPIVLLRKITCRNPFIRMKT